MVAAQASGLDARPGRPGPVSRPRDGSRGRDPRRQWLGACAAEAVRAAKPPDAVHISAASCPIAVLWGGEPPKICPLAVSFSPRTFLPRRLLGRLDGVDASGSGSVGRPGADVATAGIGPHRLRVRPDAPRFRARFNFVRAVENRVAADEIWVVATMSPHRRKDIITSTGKPGVGHGHGQHTQWAVLPHDPNRGIDAGMARCGDVIFGNAFQGSQLSRETTQYTQAPGRTNRSGRRTPASDIRRLRS